MLSQRKKLQAYLDELRKTAKIQITNNCQAAIFGGTAGFPDGGSGRFLWACGRRARHQRLHHGPARATTGRPKPRSADRATTRRSAAQGRPLVARHTETHDLSRLVRNYLFYLIISFVSANCDLHHVFEALGPRLRKSTALAELTLRRAIGCRPGESGATHAGALRPIAHRIEIVRICSAQSGPGRLQDRSLGTIRKYRICSSLDLGRTPDIVQLRGLNNNLMSAALNLDGATRERAWNERERKEVVTFCVPSPDASAGQDSACGTASRMASSRTQFVAPISTSHRLS